MVVDIRRRLAPARQRRQMPPVRAIGVKFQSGQDGWFKDTAIYGGVASLLFLAGGDAIFELGSDGLAYCAVMCAAASPFVWLAAMAYRKRVQPIGFEVLPSEKEER
jgi:hypothetical protein